MYELSIKNDKGEALSLTGNPDYTIVKIDGLGPPDATVNRSVNTTHDGSKINSTRLESRNIVLYIVIEGDIEKNRINLYKYFQIKKVVQLYFRNGSRDVYAEGVTERIECDLFSARQMAQISVICPNAYFKAVNQLTSVLGDVSSLFEFPFAIEAEGIEFSAQEKNIRKCIVNEGDVETGIVIKLYATGTVVNPVVYDVYKRTHMKLNFTMQKSDEIIINTNAGEKAITLIRGGISSNVIGHMAKSSEWFVLEPGDNVYTYDAGNGGSKLQITFVASVLYSGV